MAVAIWMLRRLDQFNGSLGIKKVDDATARKLVANGDAQLFTRHEKLKRPDGELPHKETKPANGKGKKGKAADDPPPDLLDAPPAEPAGDEAAD